MNIPLKGKWHAQAQFDKGILKSRDKNCNWLSSNFLHTFGQSISIELAEMKIHNETLSYNLIL